MIIYMYRIVCSISVLLLAFTAFSVSVQAATCGTITGPYDWENNFDPASAIVTTDIDDCSAPFGQVISTVPPQTVTFDGEVITDAEVVTIPGTTTTTYAITPIESSTGSYQTILFLHTIEGYNYINLQPVSPTEQEYRTLATEYFTDITRIEVNVARMMQDDPWEGLECDSVEYNEIDGFFDYITVHFVPKRPALALGTYTLVVKFRPTTSFTSNTVQALLASASTSVAELDTADTYTLTFTLQNLPTGASSVLFLPGIQASRLYTPGILGSEDQLWEANDNGDVRQLAMTATGESSTSVYTRDIVSEAYGALGVYAGFSAYMNTLVSDQTIKAWTPFAYDWRYSVDDVALNGTAYQSEIKRAEQEVERLANDSFSGKVTIIGHSNGGLLAKAVMIRLAALGKSDLVDTIVLLASPQLGTPKSIASLLHGYDQTIGYGYVVDDAVARTATKNMPGAYGLLPSARYFAVSTSTVVQFDTSSSTRLFRTAYGSTIDTVTELTEFLTGSTDGRAEATTLDEALRLNSVLLAKEQTLHDTIDAWTAPAGVKLVEVVGTGLDTIRGFEYRSFTERVCSVLRLFSCAKKTMYKPTPLISQFGDKTVMGQSAEGYVGQKTQFFIDLASAGKSHPADAVEHYNITENLAIQNLVKGIITNATATPSDITSVPNPHASNRIMVGTHSPVTLLLTDNSGRQTGKGIGVVRPVEDIPGSSYFELGSSSYVIVPDGAPYAVVMQGTGQGGLTFTLDTLKGEVQTPLISVEVATITPSTTIRVLYATTTITNLFIDQTGDGIADQVLTPQGLDVTPKVTYATLKSALQQLSLSTLRKAALLLLASAAETLDKNPKMATLETATLNQLEALLVTYQKNNWITAAELAQLKAIISRLR